MAGPARRGWAGGRAQVDPGLSVGPADQRGGWYPGSYSGPGSAIGSSSPVTSVDVTAGRASDQVWDCSWRGSPPSSSSPPGPRDPPRRTRPPPRARPPTAWCIVTASGPHARHPARPGPTLVLPARRRAAVPRRRRPPHPQRDGEAPQQDPSGRPHRCLPAVVVVRLSPRRAAARPAAAGTLRSDRQPRVAAANGRHQARELLHLSGEAGPDLEVLVGPLDPGVRVRLEHRLEGFAAGLHDGPRSHRQDRRPWRPPSRSGPGSGRSPRRPRHRRPRAPGRRSGLRAWGWARTATARRLRAVAPSGPAGPWAHGRSRRPGRALRGAGFGRCRRRRPAGRPRRTAGGRRCAGRRWCARARRQAWPQGREAKSMFCPGR